MQKHTRDGAFVTARVGRRSFLQHAVVGMAGGVISSLMSGHPDFSLRASADAEHASPTPTGNKVLLAYFSRAGENYYYGGRIRLDTGNTEVLTGMISRLIKCDVYRIEPVDPYPDDYEETVARNVREQEANARPAIANPLASIAPYEIVLLGSPIWNVRAPMIMSTFVEGFNFSGKTVFPFTTYAVNGLGTTVRDYTASCPGTTIGEGLAVQGEEVQDAYRAVESWLRRINLLAPPTLIDGRQHSVSDTV